MPLTPRETAKLAEIERDLLGRYPDLVHAFTAPLVPAQPDRAFEVAPVITRPRATERPVPSTIAPPTVAWRARRGPGEWILEYGVAVVLALATALAMILWVLPGTAGRF
jgi:hypothetical protein